MANVKATDLIDFTRLSKGYALAKVSYGTELVENGTFDTDINNWISGGIDGSSSQADNSTYKMFGNSFAYQGITTEVGAVYKLSVQITATTSTTSQIRAGTTINSTELVGSSGLAVGTHDFSFVATSTTTVITMKSNYVPGDLNSSTNFDNITVKKVTFNQTDGTLQLFEHPNNIPRIEYDADGNLLGLLVEAAKTNLITESNSASALSTGASVSATDSTEVTSPTGSGTVIKLDKTASGYGYARFQYTETTATRTFSVFVKKGTARYVGLRTLTSPSTHTTFDFDTGTFVVTTGSDDRTAVDVGNGWYRLSITNSSASKWASVAVAGETGTEGGPQTGTVYVFGFQREQGRYPTSYIETTGNTASRSADVAKIDVDQFGYNQSEGTVTVEYEYKATGNSTRVLVLSDGTSSNRIILGGEEYHPYVNSGGSAVANLRNYSVSENTTLKAAVAFAANDFVSSINGSTPLSDTSGNMPTGITTMNIGSNSSGVTNEACHIKSITYTPKRLSNAKLQELTS